MAATSIYLGTEDRVAALYSYPNAPDGKGSLAATVLHWFNLTLQRDGVAAQGARASVRIEGPEYQPSYFLDLNGPESLAGAFAEYARRLPQFLDNGWNALSTVIPQLKADGRWDPSPDGDPKLYRPWRFFMPHGMAMINQMSLQFFHYPPIRLLESLQDYLNDPVPVRLQELQSANGVPTADLPLFNTVMDCTPIAATDGQGSAPIPAKDKKKVDPHWGRIPIQFFHEYQRSQVNLLLNPAPNNDYYTVPIIVYGSHPTETFNILYGTNLSPMKVATVNIIPGRQTPVLASSHPYVFYASAQGFDTVGSGKFLSPKDCQHSVGVMRKDLIVTRWQKVLTDDPTLDPQEVLDDCTAYWEDHSRQAEICALVRHQGSLTYSDPVTLKFHFATSLKHAAEFCQTNNCDACAGVQSKSKASKPKPAAPKKKAAARGKQKKK